MKLHLCLGAILSVVMPVFPQGFINLNFESAVIKLDTSSVYYPYAVVASNAIPGWNAYGYLNTTPIVVPSLGYNTIALDGAAVNLETATNSFPRAIQGNYSILLQGGSQYITYTNGVSMGQTGQIPVTAQSLTYWGGPLTVTFNGNLIALAAVSSTADYTVWGADISAYAGQTGQLLFTAPWQRGGFLDNIQFSSTAVPEPGTLALITLSATWLVFRLKQPLGK